MENKKPNNLKVGILGEKTAEDYLRQKGYQILERNYSFIVSGPKLGEVDIIAKKDGVISFVEVKALRQVLNSPFNPEDKVGFFKQRKIIKTAQSWLMKNKISLESKWQIDVVAVSLDSENKNAKIQHFQNAVFC
jgi:putative endonuclease